MAMHLRHRVREFAHFKGFGHDAEAEKFVLDGHANVPPGSLTPGRLLAVNIAKNKHTPDHDIERVKQDYVYCVDQLGPYADILVVNVSSPNTPGLRSLQQTKPLTRILSGVVEAAQNVDRKKKPAVMVKVSPDEDSDAQIAGICEAVWDSGVDGVILGNTTNRRPDPLPVGYRLSPAEEHVLLEQGGYSGPQLFGRTLALVKKYRKLLNDRPQPAYPQSQAAHPQAMQSQAAHPQAAPSQAAQSQATQSTAEAPTESSKELLTKPGPIVPPKEIDGVEASVSSGKIDFKDPSDLPASKKQPLLQIPSEKKFQTSKTREPAASASASASASREPAPPEARQPVLSQMTEPAPSETSHISPNANESKVIFATGGITNGKQALDVLNAGASIAMVYTALVLGGGTISRIKDEMRAEIKKTNATKRK